LEHKDLDNADAEEIREALQLAEQLLQESAALLPGRGDELFSLHHDDVLLNNLLVTEDGKLTALGTGRLRNWLEKLHSQGEYQDL